MLARVLAVVLVLVLTSPLAGGSPVVEAKKKAKTVTKTFANDDAIAVPGTGSVGPGDPYPTPIQVRGFKKGKIKDVNLTLNDFSHEFPDDVDILLVAPNGRDALVMSDVGSQFEVSDITLELDDEAGSPLPIGSMLSGGTFQPTNDMAGDTFPDPAPAPSGNVPLSVFDGTRPNGTWQLFVNDDFGGSDGSVGGGWSLEIKAKVKKKKK
ncbi:MAG: hypothetical protein ACRDJC_03785 [Thermomicrobiales bacterium]